MFGTKSLWKCVGRSLGTAGVSLLLGLALLVSGCVIETPNHTTSGALGGAAVGAATGAVVSHHHGRGALIGAGIGALVGGVTGFIVDSETKERQVPDAPRAPQPVDEAVVQLPGLAMDPQSIPAGGSSMLHGICQTYGPASAPPSGTIKLIKDGNVLVESQLVLSHAGRTMFDKNIVLPKNAESGTYQVNVQLQYGPSQVEKTVSFRVD